MKPAHALALLLRGALEGTTDVDRQLAIYDAAAELATRIGAHPIAAQAAVAAQMLRAEVRAIEASRRAQMEFVELLGGQPQ